MLEKIKNYFYGSESQSLNDERFPDLKPVRKKSSSQLGNSGTVINAGRIQEDYLHQLQYLSVSYDTYDKMRRSDYEVIRILRAINSPLKDAEYIYEPEDINDKAQIEQATFKNAVIHDLLNRGLTSLLEEILTCVPFGGSLFEKQYQVIETKEFGIVTTLKDLHLRKAKTIKEWKTYKGELIGVRQEVYQGENAIDVFIPKNKIVLFTLNQEGQNYEGVSLLRAAYGPWKRKDLYLRLDMIGLEKNAVGVPVGFVPDSVWENEGRRAELEDVLEKYVAHENQYLILPESMKDNGFYIQKGEYDSKAVNDSIMREDMAIVSSVLASFLDIGTRQMGGNSQSETLQDMFLNSIKHIGNYIAEVLDEEIHHVYLLNFKEPEIRLKMKCRGIAKKDLKLLSEILKNLRDYINPDETLEESVRKMLKLPRIDHKTRQNKQPVASKEQKPTKVENSVKLTDFSRELTPYENKFHLEAIRSTMDKYQDKLSDTIKKNLKLMRSKFITDLEAALKQANPIKAIEVINVGYSKKAQDDIKSLLFDLYEVAGKQARKELGLKLERLNDEPNGEISGVIPLISIYAKEIVSTIRNTFSSRAKLQSINDFNKSGRENVVESVADIIDDYIGSSAPYRSKNITVSQVYNMGRNNEFFEGGQPSPLINGFQHSSVLDESTTEICGSLDKKTYRPGDANALSFRPPLHWGCRSIWVPILVKLSDKDFTGVPKLSEKAKKEKQF